jgi:hypothetical protein
LLSCIQSDSFAIHVVTGSTLEIHNTCFLGNNFKGRGAVLVDTVESVLAQSGNYATNDPNLDCQFINVGDETCVEFNSPTCLADRYREMTGATTMPPPTATEPTQSNEPNVTQSAGSESGSIGMAVSIGSRIAMTLLVVGYTML